MDVYTFDRKPIQAAIGAASDEDARLVLTGIAIYGTPAAPGLAATDSYRLVWRNAAPEAAFIAPVTPEVRRAVKAMKAHDLAAIELGDDRWVRWQVGGKVFNAEPPIESKYPNVTALIPRDDEGGTVKIAGMDWRWIAKIAKGLEVPTPERSRDRKEYGSTYGLVPLRMTLAGRDRGYVGMAPEAGGRRGVFETRADIVVEGDVPESIAVNAAFFADAAAWHGGDTVTFRVRDELKPIIFTGDVATLLMPVKI